MNTRLKLIAAAAMTVGAMSNGWAQNNTVTGSENQVQNAADRAGSDTNRATDKTGAALDNAADKTGDAAKKAADSTGSTAQRAGNALDKAAAGQGVHGTAEAPDAEGIRDVLSSTTEAALKGSFSDVVERFVDADRNRLGKAMPGDNDLKPLNDLTRQFRDDWKAKYNHAFDIEKEELVFNPTVRIIQGEFGPDGGATDRARTAGERSDSSTKDKPSEGSRSILGNADLQTAPQKKGPAGGVDLTNAAEQDRANRAGGGNISGSSNASTNSDSVKVAGVGAETAKDDRGAAGASGAAGANSNVGGSDSESTLGRAVDKTGSAVKKAADKTGDAVGGAVDRARQAAGGELDSNKEEGRNMATVMIPASHGLPTINVPLIHELPDAWRIDIPDTVDAAALRTNLQKHLAQAHQMKDQWPADANESYLAVAHHVLLAIFEGSPAVQQGSGAAAQPAADAQPAAGTTPPSGGATPTPAAAQ